MPGRSDGRPLNLFKKRAFTLIALIAAVVILTADKIQDFYILAPTDKKIRDDKDSWQNLELYIQKHSEAEFSHGLCPECVKRLYGIAPAPD